MDIKQFKNIIQSSHINFLFGSGLSVPYLKTLGNIETWLTEAESINDDKEKIIVQTSLYAKYFKDVMLPCMDIKNEEKNTYENVLNNYEHFLIVWNEIIAKRSVNLLDKQINIFTTNIDNFVELAAEFVGVEFNDGFKGHHNPIFREDSFTTIMSKVSTLYQNSARIPVFNYLKIHGSINWTKGSNNNIKFDSSLNLLSKIQNSVKACSPEFLFSDYTKDTKFSQISDFAKDCLTRENGSFQVLEKFISDYNELVMVNPRKTKFRETVLDLHFYELMRIFSNALEQSTTILMVAGFSFADEHIAKIIVRSANANPTLLIMIFAYDDNAKQYIHNNLRNAEPSNNNNILIITPSDYQNWFDEDTRNSIKDLIKFDLYSLNKYVFDKLANMLW